jgi:hypothetical protein
MSYPAVFFKSEFQINFARLSLFELYPSHLGISMKILLALPFFFLLSGCEYYRCDNSRFVTSEISPNPTRKETVRYENEREANRSWLYAIIPRHRSQIRWYDIGHWTTWIFFGNDDEGLFGESPRRPYKVHDKNDLKKAFSWWIRNPLHNFTHYTIGSAHRTNSEFTILNINCHGLCCCHYSPLASRQYGSKCTSFYLALHGGKPLISLRIVYPWKRKTEFYFGWGKKGNFGIKFLPLVNEKKHKKNFL